MYYRVIPFSRSFDIHGLTYRIPKDIQSSIQAGQILEIPYGKEILLGLSVFQEKELSYNTEDIKEITSLYDDFVYLTSFQIELIFFVSQYYFCPIHHALGLFFPKNLREKIEKKTTTKIKENPYTYKKSQIQLSFKQEEVYKRISAGEKICSLLYGVTGSGKTQIYMKIIEEQLKKDKQTLVLIPEIILSSQIGERLQKVFGEDVIFIHSGVTAAKKAQYWMDIYRGEAKIIVGTRSALFYPYNNLGMIIMDEEHDESYVSDSVPRYHTRTVAHQLCKKQGIKLLLGSGTPKVESFYAALKGDYELFQLLEVYRD